MSVIDVDNNNFESEVIKSEIPVVVDFSATWCGPCQMMKPVFHKLAESVSGVKFCACDIDKSSDIARKYKVAYVPTLVVFKDGEAVNQSVGLVSENEILDMLK